MRAPRHVKRVWILAFEYEGIAKVGGLGEITRIIAEELAGRGLTVTVIMPSHGARPSGFIEMGVTCRGTRTGVDGREYHYDLAFLEGVINGVRLVLVYGGSPETSAVIDSWPPYSYVEEKACLLTRATECLTRVYGYPDLVHANDWHSALAAVFLKAFAELRGYALPVLYQVHLRGSPSYPWHYASEQWCGLSEAPQRVWMITGHALESTRGLWNGCWGNVECFIVKVADAVATVSRSELELLIRDYGEWVRGKACYAYNSTRWTVEEVEKLALARYGSRERPEIRWRVVEELLGKYSSWGRIDLEGGEVLAVSSGRLTSQKGFDTLILASKILPRGVKVLVLGKSVGDTGYESYLKALLGEAPGNVAVVHDHVEIPTYKLLVYISHVYVLPSRYEPFGISGVESLALGVPVVVSSVGGLQEYVSDLRTSPLAVGLRVRPGDVYELATAVQSLGYLMYYSETGRGLERVVHRELRDLAIREPKVGEKLRQVAVAYVDALFRPRHTANNILACYELARQMAYYRAHA